MLHMTGIKNYNNRNFKKEKFHLLKTKNYCLLKFQNNKAVSSHVIELIIYYCYNKFKQFVP